MLPLVFRLITDNPAAFAQVGDRVYRHGFAPEGVSDPYVTWSLTSAAPENTLSGLPLADHCTVQVDVWSASDSGVEQAAKAVRDAIEPHHPMTLFTSSQEATTMRYRVSMTFTFWTHRD